jgi:L-cysteine desulfidase
MLAKQERKAIIAMIQREVVPAVGCTEPVAVALAVARAREILGELPSKITVYLSANMLKNAMGVGIPGTRMTGLPIAIALGALCGNSEKGLEVLQDVTLADVNRGKEIIAAGAIHIFLKEGITEKLYIEVLCESPGGSSCAIIAGGHTRFIYLARGEEILLDCRSDDRSEHEQKPPELTLKRVYDFAEETPFEEIAFILESARMNKAAAEVSFTGHYGHELGRMMRGRYEKDLMGESLFSRILAYTSAACDARMAGEKIPVMSNSGSGNQGISATLPVVIFAEEKGKSEEELARALILSHLTAIYIKNHMGRLAAFCGCVVAATGSSCGITRLMGGGYLQITYAVKNMIANLTGMVCDGAKPSCSLKVTSGVSTAVFSAMMAMENHYVTSLEGIIEEDPDRCIRNLASVGSHGMEETDKLVLHIMTHKEQPPG